MSNDKKRHVIPGEVITSGPYRAEQNTIQVGDNIVSTIVGLSDVHDGSVRVIPLTGGYVPKDDDLVIGKIVSHSSCLGLQTLILVMLECFQLVMYLAEIILLVLMT